MERKAKSTENNPILLPTYEESRKAIHQMLKIDESSLDRSELLAEDEPASGWLARSDTESVVKVEDQEVPLKDIRRINEENQKGIIVVEQPPQNAQINLQIQTQCTRSLLRDDSQTTFQRMICNSNREEEVQNSIIDALATELTHQNKQEERECNLDESIVAPLTTEHTVSGQFKTNPQIISNFPSQQQTLIARNHSSNQQHSRKPLLTIEMRKPPPKPQQQINRKSGPKEQQTIDLDSDSEDFQPSMIGPPRQIYHTFGSSSMLSILSRNLPSTSLQTDPISFLLAHKKKMQKKIKNAKKEFMKTITIQARRMIVNSTSGIYEYLWCFGSDINCWKPLHDIESLYELYLCQAKLHHAALLAYLPAQLETDMSYLIYKIQSSPSLSQQQQEIGIQKTLFNRLKALQVCKYFHETLLLKALEYNRWCERMEHQSAQNSLRQTSVRSTKKRTVFVDLEGKEPEKNEVSYKFVKNDPKMEVGISRKIENSLFRFKKFN